MRSKECGEALDRQLNGWNVRGRETALGVKERIKIENCEKE